MVQANRAGDRAEDREIADGLAGVLADLPEEKA